MTFNDVPAMIRLTMVIMLSSRRIIVWHKRFFCIALGERVEYDRSNCYTSSLMLYSFYITCKVFGLYNSFVWSHVTLCMIIVPLRSFWMYGHKTTSFESVKTDALILEPRFVLGLMI